MWETQSVFQDGFIAVISTATHRCEFSRRMILQRRMRTVVVVVMMPELELAPGVGERKENLHIQGLIAKPAVEGLNRGVLDRLSWPDENPDTLH